MAISTLKGSSRMHNIMLDRVMKSPMAFFDTTPLGRITPYRGPMRIRSYFGGPTLILFIVNKLPMEGPTPQYYILLKYTPPS